MKNKSVKITGAQLASNGTMQIAYKEILTDEFANEIVTTNNEIKIKSDRRAHQDLVQAFRELNYHLAIITEQFRETAIVEDFVNHVMSRNNIDPISDEEEYCQEILERTFCTGVTIKKDGQNQIVILDGVRLLKSGSIELTSPGVAVHTSNYRFLTEFKLAVDDVKDECEKYLDGKCEEGSQMEMFPDNGIDEVPFNKKKSGTTVSFEYTDPKTGKEIKTGDVSLDDFDRVMKKRAKKTA